MKKLYQELEYGIRKVVVDARYSVDYFRYRRSGVGDPRTRTVSGFEKYMRLVRYSHR